MADVNELIGGYKLRTLLQTGQTSQVFEVVETYSFGMRNVQQPLMFAIGLVVAALAAYLSHGDRSHEVEKRRFTYAH